MGEMFTALDLNLNEIKWLYEEGRTTAEIGALLGCSYTTVNRRLRDAGITPRRPGRRGFVDISAVDVIALYERGMSMRQIDLSNGWSVGTTSKYIKKFGLAPGKNGKHSVVALRRTCPGCGVEFETHNPDKLFCTKLCCSRNRGTRKTDKRRMRNSRAYKRDIPLRKLYERDNGICYLCGCATDFDDYTVNQDGYMVIGGTYPTRDHVIPLAEGGEHSWENVKLACFKCNSRKGAKPLDELEVTLDA